MAKSFFTKACLLTSIGLLALSLQSKAQNIAENSPDNEKHILYIGNKNYGIEPTLSASIGVLRDRPLTRISDIPESVRFITAPSGVVLDLGNSLRIPCVYTLASAGAGFEARLKRMRFRSTAFLAFNAQEQHLTYNSELHRRTINRVNYSGSPNGSSGGAYVFLTSAYSRINWGVNNELTFPMLFLDKQGHVNGILGEEIRKRSLYIESGVDTYSQLKVHTFLRLTDIIENSVYAGINAKIFGDYTKYLFDVNLVGGITFYDFDKAPRFKSDAVNFHDGKAYFGCSIKFNVEKLLHK